MKTHFILIITLLISLSSFAQQGINYKAIIKDSNGTILSNETVGLSFTIYEGQDLNSLVYEEIHGVTTNENGLIIVTIGEGVPTLGAFAGISWSSNRHFLNVVLDYDNSFIDLGTTEFKHVPYAKHAETSLFAENVFSGDYNDLTNQPTISTPSGLEQTIENGNTGWRLIGVHHPTAFGLIGENAVDISYQEPINVGDGATGMFSTAMGRLTTAFGTASTAMGNETEALGANSAAMGKNTNATGNTSTALGNNTTASGDYSTAIGKSTLAESHNSMAIGRYNFGGGNSESWIAEDPLFEIGNGTSSNNKNNALTVLKNGNTGIGRATPSSLLEVAHANSPPTSSDYTNAFSIHNIDTGSSWQFSTVNAGHLSIYKNGSYRGFFNEATGVYGSISDRRTKKNVKPLNNGTLNKVMQLNPVSYLMKDQTDAKRNFGLISQEVQEIFPTLTSYVDGQDLLALSYTELIPVLIKALQEQQDIIEKQNLKLENQVSENTQQNQVIQSLLQRMDTIEASMN